MGKWISKMCYIHYNSIPSAIQKNKLLAYATSQMNLKNIMQRERSHTHCTVPFTSNVQKEKMYKDRRYISNCLRLRYVNGHEGCYWDYKILKLIFSDSRTTQ